ncbi:snoRNA-binding rRNA-processing protein [Kappamyces sp. JEL0829]|nr:snoRNA-binding rRNA-processing protein [Kappamyces sp. JEL0829]KAJ3358345.1 snoRNA-binding rRNA-processing protein [Kappamyces sp. JEL0680]
MPKIANKKPENLRHDPLFVQIEKESNLELSAKPKRPKKNSVEENGHETVDEKTTQKILKMVKEQQLELEDNHSAGGKVSAAAVRKHRPDIEDDSEEDINEEAEYEEWDGEGYDALDIDQGDRNLLDKFMNGTVGGEKKRLNLSELIMSKIEAANANAAKGKAPQQLPPGMNPKVVEVYTKVGMLLSRYKSGPLPKTFKIIPTLRDWEEVLYITNPSGWTPQAMYQATRIFTSNLKAKMAQRFFSLILLERVRQDIDETKKLNYHLYMALKKSLYKPAAFFKGFLLPLCEGGDCTLREAAIIGPNSLFIRILLDKKYALPYKVIDSLVFHFLAFKQDTRDMPVLWHQSLLVFAQRYKEDMTPDQKDALVDLIKVKQHHVISAEIRRELVNSVCRGDMKVDPELDMMQGVSH